VHVGDVITMRGRFLPLAGGFVAGKSMDDRAAIAAIVLCLEELARRRHSWNVFAVATVQEEASMAGAVTGAYHIDPTIAVAVDVTFGMQPGLSPSETVKMDGGPSIAIGPNFHPILGERLTAAAAALEIPHQTEVVAGSGGTDAWAIQVSRSGVPCGLLGIPVRSMHTPVETVCLRDIERTAKLLAEFIVRLPLGFEDTLCPRNVLTRSNGEPGKGMGV
jgi:endoglucanase